MLRGGIRFQNNPKLCPRVITDFTSAIEMHNNTAMLTAPDFSNGNEVICALNQDSTAFSIQNSFMIFQARRWKSLLGLPEFTSTRSCSFGGLLIHQRWMTDPFLAINYSIVKRMSALTFNS